MPVKRRALVLIVFVLVFVCMPLTAFAGTTEDLAALPLANLRKERDEAIRLSTKALGSGSLSVSQQSFALNHRGVAHNCKGQHEHAIQDFDQAIQLMPMHATRYGQRAFAYKALGQIDRAKVDAKKGRELDAKIEVPTFDSPHIRDTEMKKGPRV